MKHKIGGIEYYTNCVVSLLIDNKLSGNLGTNKTSSIDQEELA